MNAPNEAPRSEASTPSRLREICQFEWLDQALGPLNALEMSSRWVRRKWRGLKRRLGLAATNPPLAPRGANHPCVPGRVAGSLSATNAPPARRHASGSALQAGDLVAVRPIEEIRQTLDETGKHDGLKFLRPMECYCGETHRVLKRVKYILDDRTHLVRKTRSTVLLEGVICDGKGIYGREDCDRSCFFFWKEAWLHRVDADAPGKPAG